MPGFQILCDCVCVCARACMCVCLFLGSHPFLVELVYNIEDMRKMAAVNEGTCRTPENKTRM